MMFSTPTVSMSTVTRHRKPLIVTQFLPEDGSTRPDALPPAVDPWSKDWDGGSLPTEEALPPSALASPPPTRVAPANAMPPLLQQRLVDRPPRKRRRGVVTGIVTVLVVAGAVTAAVVVNHHGTSGNANASGFTKPTASAAATAKATPVPTPKPSVSPSPTPAGACAFGTWTLTSETLKVDSSTFGTGSGLVTLTSSAVNETRTFNPDGTGELDVANTYTGTTSNGTAVQVVLTGKGTFTYRYDGTDVTYTKVVMPGTYEVDVAGAQRSDDHVSPLETTGTDPMSCSNNTLNQHGDDYSRIYARKPL
jgi:hypothetical protein